MSTFSSSHLQAKKESLDFLFQKTQTLKKICEYLKPVVGREMKKKISGNTLQCDLITTPINA